MTSKPFYDANVLGRLPSPIMLPEILQPTRGLSAEQVIFFPSTFGTC
jgi:hypothetical protein